jgi:di/tricarboxylate transporter
MPRRSSADRRALATTEVCMTRRVVGAVVGILAAVVIRFGPAIGQLDRLGQSALGVIVLAVAFWATDVLSAGITAILALGLLLALGVPASVALGGFAVSAFWILVSVLFFGYAMDKTGLARRIAYGILQAFRPTYTGIIFGFLAVGLVLALGIPSMTVRTAIMVPIAWALVQALGIPLPGRGSALIILSAFEMAVLPGCALLTGALWGPYLSGLFANQGLPLTWLGYARVMAVPTLAWCVLVLVANRIALRPDTELSVAPGVVAGELRKLGPMGRAEVFTAGVVVASLAAWASQPWHRIPPEAIGMMALAALFALGVLQPPDIGVGIPWNLALFVGGALSLTSVITTYKISAWMAGYIVPALQPVAGNPVAFALLLGLGVMAMRFIDPVGFITIAAFFLALAGVAPGWGIQPVVLAGIIVLPLHVFWFNYQNIWIVMTEGITKKAAYTDAHRVRLATVYLGTTLVALGIAVAYWKAIGAI